MGRTGYQVLSRSPWPFQASMSALGFTTGMVAFFNEGMKGFALAILVFSVVLLCHCLARWWSDMVFESTYKGDYTSFVVLNLRWGFKLFILSEVFFFISFFWAWFYSGIGEVSQAKLGSWPPVGVKAIYPWRIPLLNTILLLSSGAFANACHWGVKAHNVTNDGSLSLRYQVVALFTLSMAITLGIAFSYVQGMEYYWSSFCISDGVYGSCFYMLTGFHGSHVIAGSVFLVVCWFRILMCHFSYRHSYVGLDCAILYWHFVDVVWILLCFLVYIWGYYI
uniref:cytochrome c oxidase subunit III n=1 Tax=Ruditapes variegatus TaxID=291252 RepID=UPI002176A779|nr:cytochrome c oxidase subunit III [Ruditapes variegatus]UUA63030.1 cytochrome c oxidase subunit III [Ruditapes variegatus]